MKKLIMLSLFTYTLSCSTTFAQGTWTPRASLPDTTRACAVGFSIGNYGYMGLGTHSGHVNYPCLKDFWQFDPGTNSWTRMADFPGKARICPATFVIGNYAYVVTGQVNDSLSPKYTTECWRYNPANDTWTQKANFPGTARAYDVGFSIGSKGFVGTGSDYYQNFCKDFWEYDTATNSWKQIAALGGIARLAASGFAVGDKGYVCLGRDSLGKWHKDLWEYDTIANTWTQQSNYPGYPAFGASGFVIGTNFLFGCTQDSDIDLDNRFWQYNTVTDSWFQETSFPGHLRTSCSSFAIGDTGYMGLGLSDDSIPEIYFNSIYKFFSDSITTGKNELLNQKSMVIYPNPFSSVCNIYLPENSDKGSPVISLYDIGGRKVTPEIKAENTHYMLSRNNLPVGMYILSIEYNNTIIYKKLIIIN